ncbi:hypothetical protein FVB32_15610 [Flagellimonas hymeniacidonis]|uniref:SGNH hydrolase-type esterase domain-containing protein n=1 Tax=Flagellimonas hymeniacidonis TaxID=2603628 RepID=A0A5C8V3L6_9FLAO|nr:SGNH/GDSL hydrolase family protein [Flagellimonas hymeniacidonis]TXN35986.1 hypothetical protein FVB32_15610 [Flagellimonas hymeniacidonis]
MIKLLKRFVIYVLLFFLCLELLVRIFHLHNERPVRFLDDRQVERWMSNQEDYSVVGNRRQNVGHYRINSFGFNSVYDQYDIKDPEKYIALVGDSFIEGFHQDYHRSLGQKIERSLGDSIKVYEFGYAGYDLADQLHLIQAYRDIFKEMDHVVIYMRFTDDLERSEYKHSNRLSLDTPISRLAKHVKSIVYLKDIGLVDPITKSLSRVLSLFAEGSRTRKLSSTPIVKDTYATRIQNFKILVDQYGYDKQKNVLLLDYSLCPNQFLSFLDENKFKSIDFGKDLNDSELPTTLIYDQHWNDNGRQLIAELVAEYVRSTY